MNSEYSALWRRSFEDLSLGYEKLLVSNLGSDSGVVLF
jgi:hypothetical protein